MDSGYSADKTLVFMKTTLGNGIDNSVGTGEVDMPYQWGSSENYELIKSYPMPIRAEVTMQEVTTNGKKKEMVVLNVKVLEVSNSAKAEKAA